MAVDEHVRDETRSVKPRWVENKRIRQGPLKPRLTSVQDVLQHGIVHLVDCLGILRHRRHVDDPVDPRDRLGDVHLVELAEVEVAAGWGDGRVSETRG